MIHLKYKSAPTIIDRSGLSDKPAIKKTSLNQMKHFEYELGIR